MHRPFHKLSDMLKVALITGLFAIVTAVVTGIFTLADTRYEHVLDWQAKQNTLIHIEQTRITDCPTLTRAQVDRLAAIPDVAQAIRKAEDFSGYRQHNYDPGDPIPAGVLIATDFHGAQDFSALGLQPVRVQEGWGLFETAQPQRAEFPGTYWCIVP